jgi:DnaJ family protein A protein 5
MATPAKSTNTIRCHYEILAVPLDSSAATIKKAHRKLALKFHPDKNMNDESAGETFRLVQQAYEVLSDAQERKWYDEHREAILKGWSSGGGDGNLDILFDVTPYMVPTAYAGYADDEGGFFKVYRMVFASVFENENQTGNHDEFDIEGNGARLPEDFGSSKAEWEEVATFYQSWESFTSTLNFAWADAYDVKEAPSRRVRRAMEEENRKARRSAKRSHNEDILALVRFCKRRDPRVKERKRKVEEEKEAKEEQQKQEAVRKKKEALEARQQWRLESEEAMTAAEKEDRSRGRVRLADLEDDYNYGGSRKGKKGKKKNKNKLELEEDSEEEVEEEEEEIVAGEEEEEAVEFGRLMKNPTYYGRETPDDDLEESQDGDNENGEQLPKQAQEVGNDASSETKVTEDDDDNNDDDKEAKSEVQAQEIEVDEATQDASVEEESDFDGESESESEEEEKPDYWRCECCHKDFQSEGQMENHMRSKKHKEAWKKYEKKLAKQAKDEEQMMEDLLNEVEIKD